MNLMWPMIDPAGHKKIVPVNTDRIDGEDPSNLYMIKHRKEWDLYQIFEDDYNCSGICKPGLFYFSNPINFGPPEKTCFKEFIDEVNFRAHPFAVVSIVAGCITFLMTLLHFCLYCRPEREKDEEQKDPEKFNSEMVHISASSTPVQSIRGVSKGPT